MRLGHDLCAARETVECFYGVAAMQTFILDGERIEKGQFLKPEIRWE